LRCKVSYADVCAVDDLKMVGNSLVAWPASLKNCKRLPHPLRESKSFMRDKVMCRESDAHVASVQNNLSIGEFKGKNVALFRAGDAVIDCGNGVIVDFPTWKALREMLDTKKPEIDLTVSMLLEVAGVAEEEVAVGNAEEVQGKRQAEQKAAEQAAPARRLQVANAAPAGTSAAPFAKRRKFAKAEADPDAWLGVELAEYPNDIALVSKDDSEAYERLIQEAATATLVAYDIQWSPDFDEQTDNPIALMQLAFPVSGNTYVLQLPMLHQGLPPQVRRLFESSAVLCVGFSADTIDVLKFQTSGVRIHRGTLVDVQPWVEAETGENNSVLQGWRVGLKRAANCVLDFEMDKTSTVASSNWEREELTTAQVEYGAMDVWVALRLYQRLACVYGQ